jgi:hypothetical protein
LGLAILATRGKMHAAMTTPIIYTRRAAAGRLDFAGRFFAAVIGAGCLVVLVIAAWLTPSPAGVATHRELGLAECGFLLRTGLPCPACGMTTSFTWFAHGNIPASVYVQPMGFVLAVLCGMAFWAGSYGAITGRPVHQLFSIVPERFYLFPLLALAILAWAWKMYIHLHGIDGWK